LEYNNISLKLYGCFPLSLGINGRKCPHLNEEKNVEYGGRILKLALILTINKNVPHTEVKCTVTTLSDAKFIQC
jgi:hypothetical protein